MNDEEFVNAFIKNYLSNAKDPHIATIDNAIINCLKYNAAKIKEAEMIRRAPIEGIYVKDQLDENKLNYIPFVDLTKIESEWYLSNYDDFCVNIKDYKKLFWLKADRSE